MEVDFIENVEGKTANTLVSVVALVFGKYRKLEVTEFTRSS